MSDNEANCASQQSAVTRFVCLSEGDRRVSWPGMWRGGRWSASVRWLLCWLAGWLVTSQDNLGKLSRPGLARPCQFYHFSSVSAPPVRLDPVAHFTLYTSHFSLLGLTIRICLIPDTTSYHLISVTIIRRTDLRSLITQSIN